MSLTEPTDDPDAQQGVDQADAMVRVEGLQKHFPIHEGVFQRRVGAVRAVDGVSFSIAEGETFGLVGESGSGKTTTGRSMLRLTEPTAGTIEIDGQNVVDLSQAELKRFRKNMQIVHQDPTSSLNPRHRVKTIIEAPLKIHDYGTAKERLNRIEELLDMVDLPREFMYRYPGQLSGGQKQRVGIARAVALNPKFVVLDEPTSALDVSVQARIINILQSIQDEYGITYLFITHDLSLLRNVADRIGVMYLGRLVEVGDVESVFTKPEHPYSRALLSAISTVSEADERAKPESVYLEGEVPDPREKPSGCAFRSRCPWEFDACAEEEPAMYDRGGDHLARCYLHDDRFAEVPDW
ncbi:ABC transporter ATP-binding protein [Salinigranum halophilum]|uniref:ABC transporter ATP-binding protein n=1 Tax=Salinigranum halophilum TaxID=2565931 RepID=UPI0010A943DC|nr:ABC transporter ATP-binding protein [Salinigranum halophilum]